MSIKEYRIVYGNIRPICFVPSADVATLDVVNRITGVTRPAYLTARESASVFIADEKTRDMTSRMYSIFEFGRTAKNACESASVFIATLGRINRKPTYITSVYGFDPYYIRAIHADGRIKRTDVYAIAYHVCRKTLQRAQTGQSIRLYDGRLTTCANQFADLIQQCVVCALYGYTDGKNKYHRGYITDRIAHASDIMHTMYCAVNATLYANRIIGRNTNRVMCYGLDASTVCRDISTLLTYRATCPSCVNEYRFRVFLDDIKKRTRSIVTVKLIDTLANSNYCNADGTFKLDVITAELGYKSTTSVKRAIADIRKQADAVKNAYNMTDNEFAVYMTTTA